MQAKANQMSPAVFEILDEAAALLAGGLKAPDDSTDAALQAWAQHLASRLVDYCAVDLVDPRLGMGRAVRLATAYRDPAQRAAIDQLAARSPVVAPIATGGRHHRDAHDRGRAGAGGGGRRLRRCRARRGAGAPVGARRRECAPARPAA